MENKPLYKPFKYVGKLPYKYSVYVKKNGKIRKINFGNRKYQQYRDKGGHYKHLNHGDKERRDRYLKRAKGIKNKEGKLTWKDRNTSNYWSVHYLW